MTRFGYTLTMLLGASLGVAACTSDVNPPTPDPGSDSGSNTTPPPATTTGGDDTTFDHDNSSISVWDLIDRLTQEGPPSFSSQMHSCAKVRYTTLGRVLTSLGVNVNNTAANSASALYKSGAASLGAPNYANRVRENESVSTSGASRAFDIFAAAAPEVITGLANLERCKVNGVAPTLFDANNQCVADGITCLIGVPATAGHVELCNKAVASAKGGVETGKRIAVASMLAAYYTCE